MPKFNLQASAIALTACLHIASLAIAQPKAEKPAAPKTAIAEHQAEKPVQELFDKLLDAVHENDFPAFVLPLNTDMRIAMTKNTFSQVVEKVGARMKKGYTPAYLGSLKKHGHIVHLWKLTFDDKQDDVLSEMALKEGKVGGFYLR